MSEPFLSLRGVCCAYGSRLVLDRLDLCLDAGSRVGLLAPNGSGKTTLLKCISGLVPIKSGEILLDGLAMRAERDFLAMRRKMGLVLQEAEDQIFFPTVLEDALFGPLNLGLEDAQAEECARQALSSVGLDEFEEMPVHQLSSGQKKLLAIAGILAMRTRGVMLDEPTATLDRAARDRIMGILAERSGPMIIASHDWDFLQELCPEILTIASGRLKPISSPI